MNRPAQSSPSRQLGADVSVSVLAGAERLASLEDEIGQRFGSLVEFVPIAPDQPIARNFLSGSSILVIEVDPAQPGSLARINQVRDASPTKPLIAAVADMDMQTVRTLLRRGVNDVIALPFDAEELVSSVMDLASQRPDVPQPLAPMIGLAHSAGGIGASTVATHLAAALTDGATPARCCLVDLDLQFGELASLLGVESDSSIIACLDAGDRLDLDIVANAVTKARDNLWVLAAPNDVPPPEDIATDQLLTLLVMLRQTYDYVIIDLPPGWTHWSLSAACGCDLLLLVTDQSIRGLRRAKKTVDLLKSVEYAPEHVKLVLNRAEKKLFQPVSSDDVANALQREVVGTLPVFRNGLSKLQEQGFLASEAEPRSAFVKALDSLADWCAAATGERSQ